MGTIPGTHLELAGLGGLRDTACVTALHAGVPVPQFGECSRFQDSSGSQEGPNQEVPCSPQIPTAPWPGTGSDQGWTLCPLLPGCAQARGSVGHAVTQR